MFAIDVVRMASTKVVCVPVDVIPLGFFLLICTRRVLIPLKFFTAEDRLRALDVVSPVSLFFKPCAPKDRLRVLDAVSVVLLRVGAHASVLEDAMPEFDP